MQKPMNQPPIVGLFPLVVSRAGGVPRHGTAAGQFTAQVAILLGTDGRMVVVMIDGNYGVSVTNAAEELVGFLYNLHIQPIGVALEDIRWIYRDSDGLWDEIMPALVHGNKVFAVKYRPLGSRALADARAAIAAEGVSLSDDEEALFNRSLGLAPRENQQRSDCG